MKLLFSEIFQESRSFRPSGTGWFPEKDVECVGSPQVAITAKREEEKVLLGGTIGFTALLPCDRCGKLVELRVEEEFEYIFTLDENIAVELGEMECSAEDCIAVHLKQPVIDLGEILREQVFLALPLKVLCDENCRGLCPVCGAELQDDHCSCSDNGRNRPFDVLKQLRKEQ
ncbi:DUF177 domain-containing protein [Desulfoprunum benzoelyticum]|uniref:YceD family protein n=1 Tax=Desulfoprunum benzoelyticum TaxID=1506996 RepID=UPI001963006E|nr:DUF177 domain-containing protein [Desulfoprunum benzoelyticum]MBM9530132.1 DUF177 domain-containing protein [Desulfoprunum benzoelyticum]